MIETAGRRPISPQEAQVIRAVVSEASPSVRDALIADLDNAVVSNETQWILDVATSNGGVGSGLPDGPFPARAFVPSNANYQGEVIVWLTDGHVSGLEYAWITDDPPTEWPRPDQMEVVLQQDS
jgi:hypothetical protein